jgi:hypothetical protein
MEDEPHHDQTIDPGYCGATHNKAHSMKLQIKAQLISLLAASVAVFALMAISQPMTASAKGGSGGGGGSAKPVESRVTGYATSVDYDRSHISIGASYYGSGSLLVTPDTSISMDNVNCSLDELQLGDWVEARFVRVLDASTGVYVNVATKLSAVSVPTL